MVGWRALGCPEGGCPRGPGAQALLPPLQLLPCSCSRASKPQHTAPWGQNPAGKLPRGSGQASYSPALPGGRLCAPPPPSAAWDTARACGIALCWPCPALPLPSDWDPVARPGLTSPHPQSGPATSRRVSDRVVTAEPGAPDQL